MISSVGNDNDAFSPLLAASRFRTILSLATQQNMLMDHVNISQACVQQNYCPKTVTMASSIFLQLQDMLKILSCMYRLLKPLYSMPTAARA